MRIFLPIIFTLVSHYSFGQIETSEHQNVSDQFEDHYNASEYEQIYHLFAPVMQEALSIDQTLEFLQGLKAQAGDIVDRVFSQYEKSTYASYKTNFERALLSVNISVDDQGRINGLFIGPYTDKSLAILERNTTNLILPFEEEWTVIWGGDTPELNYHVKDRAQKNAFDFVITDEHNKTFKTDGETNEDYYAFGQKLIAPCDAEVVLVVDGIKDNVPGELNPIYVPGNTVILKSSNEEYLFFAHFKQHSIVVHEGQKVKQGELLGLCGNSGNSSEAHLHFHIQNVEDMNKATGAKCYFDKIHVDGLLKSGYSPIQGERLMNGK